jgi:predicted DNA-binding transcriptional regulator AlpA
MASTTSDTLLSIHQVARRYQVATITIHRWWKAGEIAAPIRIGKRYLRWRLSDLVQWEQEKQPEQVGA